MAWRLARSLERLRDEVRQVAPGTTVWTIGDAAHRASASDHNPNASGVVCAIDVVGDAGLDLAGLAEQVRTGGHPAAKYVIYDRRIASRAHGWTWRHYSGSNPHSTHVHVSVGRGPDGSSTGPYDDTSSWGISSGGATAEEDDMIGLKKGDQGPAVGLLQYMIKLSGEPYSDLLGTWGPHEDGVDEHFGDDTETALLKLRKDYGSGTDQGEHVTYWAVGQVTAMMADARARRIFEQMQS
ncbi:hypothetical protein F4561_006548 [Lipingzhangella halophila]|uniref:Uncharacterized protein n=1 Tax=Lipingzhangella halophila TaxID=1783352 RepID=A0A7W7W747_9ACTN|nr:hypothetical protein [Lipingzhangella halophila]MBB4935639.1 hypothetical protein [Lipingzhangella halophila]